MLLEVVGSMGSNARHRAVDVISFFVLLNSLLVLYVAPVASPFGSVDNFLDLFCLPLQKIDQILAILLSYLRIQDFFVNFRIAFTSELQRVTSEAEARWQQQVLRFRIVLQHLFELCFVKINVSQTISNSTLVESEAGPHVGQFPYFASILNTSEQNYVASPTLQQPLQPFEKLGSAREEDGAACFRRKFRACLKKFSFLLVQSSEG